MPVWIYSKAENKFPDHMIKTCTRRIPTLLNFLCSTEPFSGQFNPAAAIFSKAASSNRKVQVKL